MTPKGSPRIFSFVPLLVLPVLVGWGLHDRMPPWQFMWALAGAIFVGCKILSCQGTAKIRAPLSRRLSYLFLWPGMDARAYLGKTAAARPLPPGELVFAIGKVCFGLGLLYGLLPRLGDQSNILRGWVGMVGLIFVLHFGVFAVLGVVLRARGLEARPLMNNPIASTSVSDFWGKRWNTAFRDLTYRFLFRPLTARLGSRAALSLGFFASGLVHDLVVSFPAGDGWGGPTLFFVIQGLAIFIEKSPLGRRLGLGRGLMGWAFTTVSLLGTAGLLFHRPFIERVMLPFFAAIGAHG